MRGEGRNVSRPVEFSAARPLLADKAGRAKSGLQAASPECTPPARSRAPRARGSPTLLCLSPGKSGCPGGPEGSEDRGFAAKAKPKRTPDSRRGARGSAAGQRAGQGWRCGERKRQRCHRRGPFVTVTLPSPASTPPSPGWQKFAKSGRPGCRAPRGARPVRLTSARAPTRPLAQPPLTSAPARSPARGSHRSQINKSACGRGWRACHREGSQQSPPLLHGGRESP